jgi:hypothetical protein
MGQQSMLGGSIATTAWRALRLRMEGSPPATEGSSRGQPTRSDPLAWGLGVGLTTAHCKKFLLRNVSNGLG